MSEPQIGPIVVGEVEHRLILRGLEQLAEEVINIPELKRRRRRLGIGDWSRLLAAAMDERRRVLALLARLRAVKPGPEPEPR